jgi:putative transport protein
MLPITQALQAHPELAIFIAIVLGFLIGRIRIRRIGLGTVVGTLLAGLAVGIVAEPAIPELLKWSFFYLFLFAIGYATGPQFFAGLKAEALPQIALAVVVSGTGLATALAVAWFFRFDPGIAAGIASGGLTQSAALGAALTTIAQLPLAEATRAALAAHVPIADAVTYPFGDVGVILFVVAAAPLLLNVSLRETARRYAEALEEKTRHPPPLIAQRRFDYRVYRLDNPAFDGRTVEEFEAAFAGRRLYVERLRRDGRIVPADTGTHLKTGDHLAIGSQLPAIVESAREIGPEIADHTLLAFRLQHAEVVITNRRVAGRNIAQLSTGYGRGVFLEKITRGELELPLLAHTTVQRGDVLHATGSPEAIERAAKVAGFFDTDPARFALPFLAAGITVGILLGLVHVVWEYTPIGLGISGSILVVGLVTGWARSSYPLFGGIPEAATRVLQDVGLTVFIAVVGLTAGPHALQVLDERGPQFFGTVFAAGAIVTMVPMIVGFVFGHHVLKMPTALLLGGLAGAQTATPALNALKEASGSNVFVLGFTVPYAINNVLLTLWGTVVVTVVHAWGR